MISLDINLDIEDLRWETAVDHPAALSESVKNAVCNRVADEVDFLQSGKKFEVNLCLSNDENVHRLNKEFRHMDKPTNVLSFAAIDDPDFDLMLEEDSEFPVSLGDIIIAYETMQREAKEQGVSLKDHFCHLWAHGLLHILGYDHMEPEEAQEMEQRETQILQTLGIEDPYRE